MADFDLILRNGMVVTPGAVVRADVGVCEGKVSALGENLSGPADLELDLNGKHLFPGFVDAHVHCNEPGRADWEGFSTGSRALVAAGATVFGDMPLNSSPPATDAGAFQRKREIGEAKSCIDFALWGGLVPGNEDQIPGLAQCGAIGLKAFMAHSGLDEFLWVEPEALKRGMARAAEVGLLVAVHAESQDFLSSLPEPSGQGVRDFLDSRPIAAEVEAIRIACELAGETGCRLHTVHVSSPEGIAAVWEARKRGVDVTAETCPHYLLFDETAMIEKGAIAKCAPPLRPAETVRKLWNCVREGLVDTIGSDHSPSPPELKTVENGDFFQAWGGISSCQHAFPAFLASFGGSYQQAANLMALAPARRFGLADRKGSVEVGKDADFAMVDFAEPEVVTAEQLLYRHPMSPYVGLEIGCRVTMTVCRGRIVHERENSSTHLRTEHPCPQFLARREPS